MIHSGKSVRGVKGLASSNRAMFENMGPPSNSASSGGARTRSVGGGRRFGTASTTNVNSDQKREDLEKKRRELEERKRQLELMKQRQDEEAAERARQQAEQDRYQEQERQRAAAAAQQQQQQYQREEDAQERQRLVYQQQQDRERQQQQQEAERARLQREREDKERQQELEREKQRAAQREREERERQQQLERERQTQAEAERARQKPARSVSAPTTTTTTATRSTSASPPSGGGGKIGNAWAAKMQAMKDQEFEDSRNKIRDRRKGGVEWLDNQIRVLMAEIVRLSKTNPKPTPPGVKGICPSVSFGDLFANTQGTMSALAATLFTAQKRKVIDYEGAMLMQGIHDDVAITLLKDQIEDSEVYKSRIVRRPQQQASDPTLPAKCEKCNKTVYPTERVAPNNRVMHKTCFKCTICQRTLELKAYAYLNNQFYCEADFKKEYNKKASYNI